jgi:preprotein translocase subunit SecE
MASEAQVGGGAQRPRGDSRSTPEAQPRERGGIIRTPIRFISECWAELHKVEWPSQNQLVQGTVVVLVACIIVGTFLYANDLLWKRVVENFLI